MITGGKFTGVNINVPREYYDHERKGPSQLSSSSVDAILQDINNNSVHQKTWRVINVYGQNPITDEATYNELIDKGFEIYGDTDFVGIYSLNFNSTNQDYIDFGTGKAWLTDNDFEVELSVSDLVLRDIGGLVGQTAFGGANRWGIYIQDNSQGTGIIAYLTYNAASALNQVFLIMPFVSNGIIRFTKVDDVYSLYLDDVLMDSITKSESFSINSTYYMTVGAYFNGGSINLSYTSTGTIHYIKITNNGVTNTLNLEEGSGDTVTWSDGDVGTIKTSNVDGITYINDTMWQ